MKLVCMTTAGDWDSVVGIYTVFSLHVQRVLVIPEYVVQVEFTLFHLEGAGGGNTVCRHDYIQIANKRYSFLKSAPRTKTITNRPLPIVRTYCIRPWATQFKGFCIPMLVQVSSVESQATGQGLGGAARLQGHVSLTRGWSGTRPGLVAPGTAV